jgi:hypothetical protein
MNGKVTIDYTDRSEPLTIGDIKADDDRLHLEDIRVERYILREHQLDHLIKAAPGPVAPSVRRGEYIWGVPLTIKRRVLGLDILVAR